MTNERILEQKVFSMLMVIFVSKKQPSSEKGKIQNLFQACYSI